MTAYDPEDMPGTDYVPFTNNSPIETARMMKKRQRLCNLILVALVLCMGLVSITYILLATHVFDQSNADPVKFCYYTYQGDGDLSPENIDGELCTHLVYGFADIEDNALVPRAQNFKNRNAGFDFWKRVVAVKNEYPHLNIMLSVGAPAKVFSDVTANGTTRDLLIKNIVSTVQKFELDGIDIDWEFPAWNGMRWEDRENYVLLLKGLREAFDSEKNFGAGDHIVLTTAVAAPFTIVEISYNIKEMAKYIDYCLLMGYDFNRYNQGFPVAEFNSPLYRHTGEVSLLSLLNLQWISTYWVDRGMPKGKFVVGIPFYGVTFKLADVAKHDVGAPVNGTGIWNGVATYPQMCNFLANNATRVFNGESKVPYAYHNDDWITYDDAESVKIKVDWIIKNKFAGVMTFSLNHDDYSQVCSSSLEKFPLQTIVHSMVDEVTVNKPLEYRRSRFRV